MTILDPSLTNELFSDVVPTDDAGCFDVDTGLPLAPGMYITVDDGTTLKDLELLPLTVDEIDTVNDTASGTAPPNTTDLGVDYADPGSDDFTPIPGGVPSDGNGDWTADFGAIGVDVVPGGHVGAAIFDEDGDATAFDAVEGQRGFFEGNLAVDAVSGCEFTADSSVEVTILDASLTNELFSDVVPTDEAGCFDVDPGLPLAPGMYITVDDGPTHKELELLPLTVDEIDTVNDTASGTAPPNTDLGVDYAAPGSDDFTPIPDGVTSDGNGEWTADFGAIGVDVVPDGHVGAAIFDRDGDATAFDAVAGMPPPPAPPPVGGGVAGATSQATGQRAAALKKCKKKPKGPKRKKCQKKAKKLPV